MRREIARLHGPPARALSLAGITPGCSATRTSEAPPAALAPIARPRAPAPASPSARPAGSPPASTAAAVPPRAAAPTHGLRGAAVPVWHVGDQWAFRWESA